jgi:hypothetical protein
MIKIVADEHIPKSLLNRTKSQEQEQVFRPHSSLLDFHCDGLSCDATPVPYKKDMDDIKVEISSSVENTDSKTPVTPKTPKKSKKIKMIKAKEIRLDLLSPKGSNGSSRRKISRSTPESKSDLETQRVENKAHKKRIIKKALSSQKKEVAPVKMSTSQALDDLNLRFAASQCIHAPTGVVIIGLNPDEMTQSSDISKLTLPPELDYSIKQNPFNDLSDIADDHPRPPSRAKTPQFHLRKKQNEPHHLILPPRIQEEQQERPSEDRDTCPKPPGRNSSFTRSAPGKTSSFSQMASDFVGKGAAFMHAAAKKVETSLLSVTSNGDEKEKETPHRATKALGLKLATESTTGAADRTKPAILSQSLHENTMSPAKKLAGFHLEGAKQTSLRSLKSYQPRSTSRAVTAKPDESLKAMSNSKSSKSVSNEKISRSSKFEEYDTKALLKAKSSKSPASRAGEEDRSSIALGTALDEYVAAEASPTSKSSTSLASRTSGKSRSSRTLAGSALEQESKKLSSRSSRTLGSAREGSKKLSRSSRTLGSALEEYTPAVLSPKSIGHVLGAIDDKQKPSKMLSPKQFCRKISMSKSLIKSPASKSSEESSSCSKTRSELSSVPTSPELVFGDDKTTFEPKPSSPIIVIKTTQTAILKQEPDASPWTALTEGMQFMNKAKTPAGTSSAKAREEDEDEETVEIQSFDENGSKAVEVEGGEEEASLHFRHGILCDIEDCDENSERSERSDYSGEEYVMALKGAPVDEDEMSEMISAEGASPARSPRRKIKFMALKGGAQIDDEDEMSEMMSTEGASPATSRPKRKIKFMPKSSSGGDAYSDIIMSNADTMPSLDDFSMEDDYSMESEETVPINDSSFSALKKGMDKPTPKNELMSPAGKSGVNKYPDKSNKSPVRKSWRALKGSVDSISETKKRVSRITRNQRRTIVEDNPIYDDDIDSAASPLKGDTQTLAAQLGSDLLQPHIEVVDGKTRLVFELTSAESSMDLEKKLGQAMSARI